MRKTRALSVVAKQGFIVCVALLLVTIVLLAGSVLRAAGAVNLGTAESFAVLAGETITNAGITSIDGSVGLHPGSAVTGFETVTVQNGTIEVANPVAAQAKSDLLIAYNDLAGRASTATESTELGGKTLLPGVYTADAPGDFQITGALTLDAGGDPAAIFIFQMSRGLNTGTASSVMLINGGDPCNVFWQVGSSATLGTATAFTGSILALTSISLNAGATIDGRALARNGSVTMLNNTIGIGACAAAASPTPSATPSVTSEATAAPTATPTTNPTATPTTSPAASPSPTAALPLPTASLPLPTLIATPSPTPVETQTPLATLATTPGPTPIATASATATATARPTPRGSVLSVTQSEAGASPEGLVALGESGDERGLPGTGIPLATLVLLSLGLIVIGGILRRSARTQTDD